MQFRAGAIYTVLFLVVAASAYGVIATAESPSVTIDEADADHQLEEGDEFTVGDQTYNVSELSAEGGTLEYVNDSAILEAEWSDGDTVQLEEDGTEYTVMINQPEEAEEEDEEENETEENGEEANGEEDENGDADEADEENGEEADDGNGEEADEENGDAEEDENGDADEADEENGEEADDENGEEADDEEAQPESFTLIEEYDEDEYQVEEIDERQYVIVEENGELTAIPIEEFDEFDAETYEIGDSIEFFEGEEMEEQVEGEVVDISTETVTIEYEGEEVTEFELVDGEVLTIDDEEFGVYFPSDEQVYLTEDVESFEQQQADVEQHSDQIHGLWWVVVLSLITVSLIAGLAFMPVRG